jgi:hypothetical protein
VHQPQTFTGALRYEFRMQIHRGSVWITYLCFAAVLFALLAGQDWLHNAKTTSIDDFTSWTLIMNLFLPITVGVLLADRLPRDKKTRVDELLNTLPGKLGARVFGKYLGSTLATLVPVFIIYSLGLGYILYFKPHDIQALALVPALFVAVVLPGTLFVAAFSIACPAIMWVPLYQFLFIGYWFWGNLLPPGRGIPTLSNTILTPLGDNMLAGFFGESGLLIKHATVLQGIESILLLLGLAAFALFVLWRYLLWQQARQ